MTTQAHETLGKLLQAIGRGWVRINSIAWLKSSVVLVVSVDARRGGKTLETWSIVCKDVREYRITDVNGGGLAVYDGSHPVVRQYLDETVSLHIGGTVERAGSVLGDLLRAHWKATDDWIAFDAYLRPDLWATAGAKGKMATGPRFLLTAYADVLRAHGLRTRLIGDGSKVRGSLAGLHLGNSYLVARSIRAKRH